MRAAVSQIGSIRHVPYNLQVPKKALCCKSASVVLKGKAEAMRQPDALPPTQLSANPTTMPQYKNNDIAAGRAGQWLMNINAQENSIFSAGQAAMTDSDSDIVEVEQPYV